MAQKKTDTSKDGQGGKGLEERYPNTEMADGDFTKEELDKIRESSKPEESSMDFGLPYIRHIGPNWSGPEMGNE